MNLQSFRLIIMALMLGGAHGAAVQAGCAVKKCDKDCAQSITTWLPRAFSSYSLHDIYQDMSVSNDEDQKVNFTFYTEYMRNIKGKCKPGCKNLGSRVFWSGDNTLTIGNNDGKAQLDAYQLGLGNVVTDADGIAGKIQLNPEVQHVGTNMMMYYAHHKQERGMYFKLHAPLGAMMIRHNLKELSVAQPDGQLGFTQTTANPNSATINYQFTEYPSPERRPESVSEVFHGGSSAEVVFKGNLSKPIRFRKARFSAGKLTTIRLGDITTALGYNVFANEKGHVGIGFKASMPTGNVPTADYALEPIFGRAGLWGLGGEVSGAYRIWENEEGTRNLHIRMQGEVLHLINGRGPSFRTFDLRKNGPGSKYMLLQQYLPVYSQQNPNTEIIAPFQLIHASNITTIPVKSTINAEGSLAVMLDFNCHNWFMGVAGEFWGRSCEKLKVDHHYARDLRLADLNEYAVVGRQVSAYTIDTPGLGSTQPLNTYYCEPAATICKSQPAVVLVGNDFTQSSAQSAAFPVAGAAIPTTLPDGIKDARLSENRIPSKVTDALDIEGGQAGRAFTGKIHGTVGYTFAEHYHMPTIALTGGAELTNKGNNAVQYWSVGLSGSLNF